MSLFSPGPGFPGPHCHRDWVQVSESKGIFFFFKGKKERKKKQKKLKHLEISKFPSLLSTTSKFQNLGSGKGFSQSSPGDSDNRIKL